MTLPVSTLPWMNGSTLCSTLCNHNIDLGPDVISLCILSRACPSSRRVTNIYGVRLYVYATTTLVRWLFLSETSRVEVQQERPLFSRYTSQPSRTWSPTLASIRASRHVLLTPPSALLEARIRRLVRGYICGELAKSHMLRPSGIPHTFSCSTTAKNKFLRNTMYGSRNHDPVLHCAPPPQRCTGPGMHHPIPIRPPGCRRCRSDPVRSAPVISVKRDRRRITHGSLKFPNVSC